MRNGLLAHTRLMSSLGCKEIAMAVSVLKVGRQAALCARCLLPSGITGLGGGESRLGLILCARDSRTFFGMVRNGGMASGTNKEGSTEANFSRMFGGAALGITPFIVTCKTKRTEHKRNRIQNNRDNEFTKPSARGVVRSYVICLFLFLCLCRMSYLKWLFSICLCRISYVKWLFSVAGLPGASPTTPHPHPPDPSSHPPHTLPAPSRGIPETCFGLVNP